VCKPNPVKTYVSTEERLDVALSGAGEHSCSLTALAQFQKEWHVVFLMLA
jgi:hypothetical protein